LISEDLLKDEEESFKIQLPAVVQMTGGQKEIGEWKSYAFSDGEYEMQRCAFISKQPQPEIYSILKIKKISNLTMKIDEYIDDYGEDSYVQYLLGEIDFEIEVGGEKIGHLLHEVKSNKHINMEEIRERKKVIGVDNLIGTLSLVDPTFKVMRLMWQNRSAKFCDVNFSFADDPENVAFAHRSVLMSNSDIFNAHFNGEEFCDLNSVHIVDAKFYYFNKFLEYIYTGKVQFTTLNVTFELLYLSKKYLVTPLQVLCQEVIEDHCFRNPASILKLLTLNQRSNDTYIQEYLETRINTDARIIINSADFLNCDYATIEWILSMTGLYIDEWSLLCALYKWAHHNECNAFCHNMEDGGDLNQTECLHGLLECIRFENIDGSSLQRFFNLPKLTELVSVDALKNSTFDSILENESYFKDVGPINYSKFRKQTETDFFYIEHMVENDSAIRYETTRKKNLCLSDGSVFGLEVKLAPDVNNLSEENTMAVCLSFQFLYSLNESIENPAEFVIEFCVIRDKLGKAKVSSVDWDGELSIGEHCDLRLVLSDYRDYLSDKIEDIKNSGDSRGTDCKNVLGLELVIWS